MDTNIPNVVLVYIQLCFFTARHLIAPGSKDTYPLPIGQNQIVDYFPHI